MNTLFSWQYEDYYNLRNHIGKDNIFICGNKGCGKKFLLEKALKEILVQNKNLITVEFKPSEYNYDSPYIEFIDSLIENLESDFKPTTMFKKILSDLSPFENATEYLLDNLDIFQEHTLTKFTDELGNDILVSLQKIFNKHHGLMIFYNLHDFNSNSKNLLNLMLSGKIDNYYPFLLNLNFIFISETDTLSYLPAFSKVTKFLFKPPCIENIDEIVSIFNTELNLSMDDKKTIFNISGGNLSLIKFMLENIGGERNRLPDDFDSIAIKILEKRLIELGANKAIVEEVLEIAALIGLQFSLHEIEYILSNRKEIVEMAIENSRKINIITEKEKVIEFANQIVRELFLAKSTAKKKEYHRKIAECIGHFQPNNYEKRGHHYLEAGDDQRAFEMLAMAYNRYLTQNIQVSESFLKKLTWLSRYINEEEYIESIESVYKHMEKHEYINALLELEGTVINSRVLTLEKEYLVGLLNKKIGLSKEYYKNALNCFTLVCDKAKDTENELWFRGEASLISLHVNYSGDISEALKLFKELSIFCMENAQFDRTWLNSLYNLYRKSSAVFEPSIAVKRLKESTEYFANSVYQSEYIKALNNYSGTLSVIGEFDEAVKQSLNALTLIKNNWYSIDRYCYATNNYCISAYYCEKVVNDNLIRLMSECTSLCDDYDLKVILLINCACLNALIENNFSIAQKMLIEADELNKEIGDDYYNYYIKNNQAIVLYLKGKQQQAVEIFKKNCSNAPALSKASEKGKYKKRYKLLLNHLSSKNKLNAEQLNNVLIEESPDEDNLWKFYGRAFLLSDLQYWTES